MPGAVARSSTPRPGIQSRVIPTAAPEIADVRYRDRWYSRAVPEGGARFCLHMRMAYTSFWGWGVLVARVPRGLISITSGPRCSSIEAGR